MKKEIKGEVRVTNMIKQTSVKVKSAARKFFSVAAATTLICVAVYSIPASAAVTYKGSGTRSDPYLVETPQQLDGMRENLSANYKLAANIDMNGFSGSADPTPKKNYAGGFVPIGMFSQPFTGTFTCDVNADGMPKFQISNLKITNKAGEIYGHALEDSKSYSDYVNGKSYWEAALFGAVKGGTISNIKIDNAYIVNTVLMQNQMNGDYTINPGMSTGEISSAILVGNAKNTNISNCHVNGQVSGRACAALLCCVAESSKISDCSTEGSIDTKGLWCVGAITGSQKNTTFLKTYANANVSGPNNTGLFAGGAGGCTFTDCYALGTVNAGDTFVSQLENAKKVTNCYSAGTRTDGQTASGSGKAENSYIVIGGNSSQLPAVSKAELKTKFTGLENWDVSGDLPTLKKRAAATSGGSTQGGSVATGGSASTGGETEAVDGSKSTVLINGIDVLTEMQDLPDAYKIEEKDYEFYLQLYSAYMDMPVSMKTDITEEQDANIKEIGKVVSGEVIKQISNDINKLPETSKLTSKDRDKLSRIVRLYKLVPSEFRSEMSKDVYKKLCDSLKALEMEGLLAAGSEDSTMKIVTWLIIGINALLLAGTVVFVTLIVVMYVKKKKAADYGEDDIVEKSGDDI